MPGPTNPLQELQRLLTRKLTVGGGTPTFTRRQSLPGLTMPPVSDASDDNGQGGGTSYFTPGRDQAGGSRPLRPTGG